MMSVKGCSADTEGVEAHALRRERAKTKETSMGSLSRSATRAFATPTVVVSVPMSAVVTREVHSHAIAHLSAAAY